MIYVKFFSDVEHGQPTHVQCRPHEFMCANGAECIESTRKCDRNYDCHDYSDESDCRMSFKKFYILPLLNAILVSDEVSNEVTGGTNNCLSDEFKCVSDNQCIHITRRCDKNHDCNDYSDEKDCCK